MLLARVSLQGNHPRLIFFFVSMAVGTASMTAAFAIAGKQPGSRLILYAVIAWALIFRVTGFFGAPVYEDDFYRYLWDGRSFALTGNPYAYAPSHAFGNDTLPERFEEILGRINYPEIPTIYGPVCQLTFLIGYWIAPGELWPLKLIYLLADLGILWLLWKLAPDPRRLILYAWCPLVIKEVAFTAHTDVLVAFFVLAAVERTIARKVLWAALLLALAVASKIIALVFVPLLLWRAPWKAWAVFAGGLVMLYAPFVLRGASESGGLTVFASEWEFNSFAFAALARVLSPDVARLACIALFAAVYLWIWSRKAGVTYADILLGAFFLLSPVVNPWYLLLLAPFVALRPSAWGVTALTAVLLSYSTGMNLDLRGMGPFDHPWWVRPAEMLPVLIAVFYDRFHKKKTSEDLNSISLAANAN